jgi:hypothetical protein
MSRNFRLCPVGDIWKYDFLTKSTPFFSNLDSRAIRHQIGSNFNTRVTSTQGTSSQKRFFSNLNISLSILDELKNLGFGGTRRNP